MTTVENSVQDAVLTALENLVNPRLELATKSANAFSRRSVDGNVLEPDQRNFLGNIESLQRTSSNRINSRTDLNRIDETRGENTAEGGHLVVNERNIDRQTYTHHIVQSNVESWKLAMKLESVCYHKCKKSSTE